MMSRRAGLLLIAASVGCSGAAPVVGGKSPAPATTPASIDYSRLEREVASELNAARSNPAGYAAHVSALLRYFDGNVLQVPGGSRVRTVEGPAAVREAVAALQRQPAVPRVSVAAGLTASARDLLVDQTRTGSVGHSTSDGATLEMRISRRGTWQRTISENIAYGSFAAGRDVVVNLIVDDNVPNRGHRRNIFDPNVTVVGIACGRHPRFGMSCVIDQAGGFVPK